MRTRHEIFFQNSNNMKQLQADSVDMVVTSPPYPMIEMWDDVFSQHDAQVAEALRSNQGPAAFELMHRQLDSVWSEVCRVLKDGGIACINIGDATRTLDGHFALYTNHSRLLSRMQKLGFSALPPILWRKQTNAPNKFMGSGMLPPGAYVTLEHEYVLVLRKGNRKEFKTGAEKDARRESAFFWEERNLWFSDVWMDVKGATQNLFDDKLRGRSAAFPFELPYRLISMFSVKADTVLDPFLGNGTSMYAAIAAGRNSIGYEIDENFSAEISSQLEGIVDFANSRIRKRLGDHLAFVEERADKKEKLKHVNRHYQLPVMTSQETDLLINELIAVEILGENQFEATYSDEPQREFVEASNGTAPSTDDMATATIRPRPERNLKGKQRELFG